MSRIKPIPGEYGRFWYESDRYKARPEDGKMTYILEKDDYGKWACSCTDFTARCIPNRRKHKKHVPYSPKDKERCDCKHIAMLLKYLEKKNDRTAKRVIW